MSTVLMRVDDLNPKDVELFRRSSSIAWDSETTGLEWSRDRLATCQLSSPDVGDYIVQLSDSVPTNLCSLLVDESVIKIFHHAPFDLRFMQFYWSVHPRNIRCTKVASKLLRPMSENREHSLARLTERYLGTTLNKGAVRTSSWTDQNLSPDQIAYAIGDVQHLIELEERLRLDLAEEEKLGDYYSCCSFIPTRVRLELGSYPDVFSY